MKDMYVDFSNTFVRNVALGLGIPIDENYITTEEWGVLQGTIASCAICYYFGKMHMTVLQNALERTLSKNGIWPRLTEEQVANHINALQKVKGTKEAFESKLITNVNLSEENSKTFKDCVEKIDSIFENNCDELQLIIRRPIYYIEDEIMSRKNIENYISLESNIEKSKDYYILKKEGIEDYLAKETPNNQVIMIKK